MKLSLSLSLLGLLGIASVIPAAADSLNLNTGNGTSAYTITSDTLDPNEGTTVTVVTSTAPLWVNDLSSEWISPQADQSWTDTFGVVQDSGSVTYDTSFFLPVGFSDASLNITLAADDWATISLNGNPVFYTGPDTGEWKFDTILPDSPGVDSQLMSGLNTLEFVVYNTGGGTDAGGGPTGLNAQVSVNYSTSAVPEPSSALPLAVAILLGGWVVRRRRAVA